MSRIIEFVQERKKIIAVAVVFIISISFASTFLSTTTTIYNDIQSEMYLYDVGDHDGDPSDRLLNSGDRVYTTLKVKVIASALQGLSKFVARLLDESQTQIIISQDMTPHSPGSNVFYTQFDVDGFATGVYWADVQGIPTTHIISYEITNPDWTAAQVYLRENDEASLEELVKAGYYGGKWPIPQTIPVRETKDDVDIIEPSAQRIWIENPWKKLGFNFELIQASPSSPVTFNYEIYSGVADGVSLVILDSYNTRVTQSDSPNSFIFNADGAQADGTYTATLYVVGQPGWIGDTQSIDFYIDNIDDIDGTVRVLVLQDGGYVEVGEGAILKGIVIIEAEITSGNASDCMLKISGPKNESLPMTRKSPAVWTVELDTRQLVNGDYELSVEVVRAEDGARAFLSVLAAGVFDGVDGPTGPELIRPNLTIAYGVVVLLFVIYVYYRWKRQ